MSAFPTYPSNTTNLSLNKENLELFDKENEGNKSSSATTPPSTILSSLTKQLRECDRTSAVTARTATSSKRIKTYYCHYEGCNKVFTRPCQLTEHQQIVHHEVRQFVCPECGNSYTRKHHLERHLVSHTGETPFHCSICNKGVVTRQQLKRHEITHTKSFICEICGESFYKHPQLRSHRMRVHEKKLTCQICGKNFQRPYRLNNHMDKHHNPNMEDKYRCNMISCTKSFPTWTSLQLHIKNDHPKFKCAICGKYCIGEKGLQMHMTVHDESMVIRSWKCMLCVKDFAKKNDLLNHLNLVHSTDGDALRYKEQELSKETNMLSNKPNIEVEKKQNDKKKPTLKTALRTNDLDSIRSEINLKNHIKDGKSTLSLLLHSVGKKYNCIYSGCYRKFKTKERFDRHIEKHKIHELKLKELELVESQLSPKQGE
ncbi:related to Transcription factor IIIA [Saccharomycodes ludwigii]|uniref:Transcription factor IIIA n=1 Tax=Saccharomycodes ludwigii TaxID=36035 RepID=A0A376B493_9ASCO|nr:hypothetical protein SCDLUD_000009 [Saccharomycodes ludwigii]KAH3902432.1 hypothetical protein SCDLUD_000009 [Saccharomycodes ludwigii]SSD59493.1 related to Transcription factor IIIA [Saccharomycodes ludwigii]